MSGMFPARKYADPAEYLIEYAQLTMAAWESIDEEALRRVSAVLLQAYSEGRQIFVCGNGGSCAVSDHFECDHMKGIHSGTSVSPRVRSLVANTALLTAIANDLAYDQVFVFPLAQLSQSGDVLLVISSSGNSQNIVNAIQWANSHGLTTIAFTGFNGGKARELAHITLHVDAHNYGVIEDVHQGLAHVLAQYIRQSQMAAEMIPAVPF